MSSLSVEYINPFLMASTKILKELCSLDAKIGKPYIRDPIFANESIIIMIGITGEMRGQVMITFDGHVALDIASKMMMAPVTVMDEMAKSAVGELGNMILGNAATIFSSKGIVIDITPPTIGDGRMTFSSSFAKNICIPLIYDEDKAIEVNLAIQVQK